MIVQDNKLIAIFMGVDSGNGEILQYHKSWDWLIPVINKIYSSDDYVKYKNSLNQFSDGIYINTEHIDETYGDVIDYIKWHNAMKQNKKN